MTHKVIIDGIVHHWSMAKCAKHSKRSTTFLNKRLDEGMDINDAMVAVTDKSQYKRRSPSFGPGYGTDKQREHRAEKLINQHKDVFSSFLLGAR